MKKEIDKLADAVKDTLKTAPTLYEDALQPAVQEAGKFAARIPHAINAALSDLDIWILKKEYNIDKTKKLLACKLENIEPEKIVTPETYVAVPAIQSISYSMDSEELRNLYANLLAKSMNSDTKDFVHPAFVEIIRQMSPIDAQIFENIRNTDPRPLITISMRLSDGGLIPLYKNCSWIREFSLQQCCTSFNNLSRLKLINLPATGAYTYENHYTPVRQNILFTEAEKHAKEQLKNGASIVYEKHFIELNEFSDLFYNVCVKNDTSAMLQ